MDALANEEGHGVRILIVEDEPALRQLITEALEANDYIVETASNGEDALCRLEHDPLPAAIVLDLHLPGMDGWQFRLRQRASPRLALIPVVAISADSSAKAHAIDAAEFLSKPFSLDELAQGVAKAMALAEADRARTARLAHMDRLASLGTLAAGVGHEINNPLSFIIGSIDYVAQELRVLEKELPARRLVELNAAVGEVREGADRIRRIVRDLRAFARVGDGELRPIDLRALLDTSANISFSEIRHRGRLVKDYGPPAIVDGDETRLIQVFVNLLINAAQALLPNRSEQNEVRIRTSVAPPGNAMIEIIDTGCGIAEKDWRRIFAPFFTTKPVDSGTGLGLSICQSIVRAHHGEISFASELGKGTTFTVLLPLVTQQSESPRRPEVSLARGPKATVLIVDDEDVLLIALSRLLAPDYDVTALGSAREALELIRSGRRFDVILSDVTMPDLLGVDLFVELQAVAPDQNARMIFMCGGTQNARARAVLESASNPWIDKPFDPMTLKALIRTMLR